MARTTKQRIAAINAGHIMAGMPLQPEDIAMLRRIGAGKTTADEERARILAEIARDNARTAS